MDGRVKVTVEGAPRKDTVGIARPIKLELVHMIFIDHLEADPLKLIEVFWPRQRIAVVLDLEAVRLAIGYAFILLLRIASPWGKPHSYSRVVFGGRFAGSS